MKMIKSTMMVFALASITLTSCKGESVDGAALAQEVCACNEKANALPADDPNREEEQNKCSELQKKNWDKVKDDSEQKKAFNDQFPCGF